MQPIPVSDLCTHLSLSVRDVNPIEPVHNRRSPDQADQPAGWGPTSRNSAAFGRGVRWKLFSSRSIDWYVAMSLPMGLIASLLLVCVPVVLSIGPSSGASSDPLAPNAILLAVWVIGLLVQCIVAMACLTDRGKPFNQTASGKSLVTVTVGGVWATTPAQGTLDDGPSLKDPPVENSFAASLRIVVMWLLILLCLAGISLACLAGDSISSGAVDRPWIAAAWIFGLQLIWQLLPLPQSLGRTGWSIVMAWLTPTNGLASINRSQVIDSRAYAVLGTRRVRWWVIAIAFLCLTMGILAIEAVGLLGGTGFSGEVGPPGEKGFSGETGGQPLPILAGVVLLSLWLFASSRNEDLFATQLTLAENGETGALHGKVGVGSQWRRWRQHRIEMANTERLKAAVAREQSEASDAARVDEILERMHESGVESLTTAERELLQRVSEAIRRQRERDGHDTD